MLAKLLVILAIAGAIILVAFLILNRTSDTAKTVETRGTDVDMMICACFFKTHRCPDAYVFKNDHSSLCPPDGSVCTVDENEVPVAFSDFFNTAPDNREERERWYGTLCTGPSEPVRLRKINVVEVS